MAFRQRMVDWLREGAIKFDDPKVEGFRLLLSTADAVAGTIFRLSWTVLAADGAEFVISDRALALHDPTPCFPWSGQAWRSSPNVETIFPLGPGHCLLFKVGPARCGQAPIDAAAVRAINLRSYGWAERFIYGRNQEVVTTVRRQAKQHPDLVIRPRPSKQILVVEADPKDPDVGRENLKRGWPKGVWQRDESGKPVFLDYTVIDPSDQKAGGAAVVGSRAGQRVMTKARASRGAEAAAGAQRERAPAEREA